MSQIQDAEIPRVTKQEEDNHLTESTAETLLTFPLTRNRAFQWPLSDLRKDASAFVKTVTEASVSVQIPIASRKYMLSLLVENDAYDAAVDLALKSLSMRQRPQNERISEFMTFCIAGALVAIQRYFTGIGDPDTQLEAAGNPLVGKYEREASILISKCEELLGGGGEISALITNGGDPNEFTLLPFQTIVRKTNLIKENAGLTESATKALINNYCVKITTLNAIFNLVLAFVHGSSNLSSNDDMLEYLERAAILFDAAKSKKANHPGVDLGCAALSAAQGEWNEVLDILQKEGKVKRRREYPEAYHEIAASVATYAAIMAGKYAPGTDQIKDSELALLSRDICLENWQGFQSLSPQSMIPSTVLVLSDALFSSGNLEAAQNLLEALSPYCLRSAKRRRVDPALNKRLLLSEYFYQRGRILHVLEENDTAAEELRAALSSNPALHAARFELARCTVMNNNIPNTQLNAAPLGRRFPAVALNFYKETAMKAFLSSSTAMSDAKAQTEILGILQEVPEGFQIEDNQPESILFKRLKLSTLTALVTGGNIDCCREAYEVMRSILQTGALEAPRKPRQENESQKKEGEVLQEAEGDESDRREDLTETSPLSPDMSCEGSSKAEHSDAHNVTICLKRTSVPVEYCITFAYLQLGLGMDAEACQILHFVRNYIRSQPHSSNSALLEQVTLAHMGALFMAEKYSELHGRVKRISADKNSKLAKRKEFTVLRILSYMAKNELHFARQLAERMISVLHSELVGSGGRDANIWEYYLQAVDLAFLCRTGISTDPFHDKTKELIERALRKESQRLSDDPSAAPMPAAVKSRLLTLSGWLSLERGLRRRHHEKRLEQEKKRTATETSSNSTKHLNEARECARTAFGLDATNWRACYLIGRASRELQQPAIAARVYRLMADTLQRIIHPTQRPFMEFALLREGTFSLASARKPHSTHTTKLHRSISAVLAIQPDDHMFLVDLADIIVDGTLAGVVVPFFADMMSRIKEPTLLAQNAYASLKTKELLSRAKNLDNEKDLEVVSRAIEEAQLIVEMYETLMRQKMAAKRAHMDRSEHGQEAQRDLTFDQLRSRDFPICGVRLVQGKLSLPPCPPPPPLRELERLPKDESLRRLLDRQVLPLLRRLREAEPLMAEKLKARRTE